MKNIVLLTSVLVSLLLIFGSCQKREDEFRPSNDPTNPGYNNNYNYTYSWPGCFPKAPEFLGKNEAPGWPNVFDYKFRLSLDGSQVDPNPLDVNRFSIPHVGPNGVLIYNNVENDATYTITGISNGFVYYTIRSEKGHELKYNISIDYNGKEVWFLRYGLTKDDGETNVITFFTN